MFSNFAPVALMVSMMALATAAGWCQNYPARPIRIVTTEPGSSADIVARLIAQETSGSLGQPVIVDSQGGASGIIAAQAVAKSAPDGYTLLFYGSGIWTLPLIQSVPYDPIKDFSAVTWAVSAPNVLVVHPSLRVYSVKEFVALAKSKPGELNYASGGVGSSNHLATELFKAMAGVDIVRIPYKGTGPALTGLLGGQVQLMFPSAASVAPHLKSGRLRALAVGSAEPSALTPGLSTIAASGLPGYESAVDLCMFAPAKTPNTVVNVLNQEIVRVLTRTDIKEKLLGSGLESVASSPDRLSAKIKSEMVRLGKVIKDAGIRAE